MRKRISVLLIDHLQQNRGLYIIVVFLFILGIIAGAIGVSVLSNEQQKELAIYLDKYLGLENWQVVPAVIAKQTVFDNLKLVCLIWFLGLTVVGIPIIFGVIFLRGFILGFTIGFLIGEKAVIGFLLALFSVLPQNMFNIPALIWGSVLGLSFSIWLIRGRFRGRQTSFLNHFTKYCLLTLLIGLIAYGGGLVEAYLSPFLVRVIVAYFF